MESQTCLGAQETIVLTLGHVEVGISRLPLRNGVRCDWQVIIFHQVRFAGSLERNGRACFLVGMSFIY